MLVLDKFAQHRKALCLLPTVLASLILSAQVSMPQKANPKGDSTQPPSSGVTSARFQVILTGFRVNHQTADDVLERDGAGDEVFHSLTTFLVSSAGHVTLRTLINGLRMGDIHRDNQILAGSARGIEGGLRSGDSFPRPGSYEARHPIEVATAAPVSIEIPGVVLDEVLTRGDVAAVIFSNLWEWDGGDNELMTAYRRMLPGPNLGASVARLIPDPRANVPLIKTGRDLQLVLGVTLGDGPLGLGEVGTRPIGMTRSEGYFYFNPKALILTYDGAMQAARSGAPIETRYVDDARLQGDYSLFFQVVRVA